MEEIFKLCETISILRDGKHIATLPAKEITNDSLVQMMVGRKVESLSAKIESRADNREILRVENHSCEGMFSYISFTLRAGEILGFAGLVGSGRTETAEAIFGLNDLAHGDVYIRGEKADIKNPSEAMQFGIGLVPEDRKRHGLILMMEAKENISLPNLKKLSYFGWINNSKEEENARRYFDVMKIKASGLRAVTASLSGGNQQKIVIAKWLASNCEILFLDEPTRGIDVGAKAEIHSLICELANKSKAILLISSELPELLNLSTRIIVFRNGRIAGELNAKEATQDMVLRLMTGIQDSEQKAS